MASLASLELKMPSFRYGKFIHRVNSNLYAFAFDGSFLGCFKSTDNGANWVEVDAANAPIVDTDTSDSYSIGNMLYVAYAQSGSARVRRFDTTIDSWLSLESGITSQSPFLFSPARLMLVVMLDGTYVIFHQGPTSMNMGSSFRTAMYSWFRSGSWSSANVADKAGNDIHIDVRAILRGDNRVHLFYSSSDGQLYVRTVNSNDVLSSENFIDVMWAVPSNAVGMPILNGTEISIDFHRTTSRTLDVAKATDSDNVNSWSTISSGFIRQEGFLVENSGATYALYNHPSNTPVDLSIVEYDTSFGANEDLIENNPFTTSGISAVSYDTDIAILYGGNPFAPSFVTFYLHSLAAPSGAIEIDLDSSSELDVELAVETIPIPFGYVDEWWIPGTWETRDALFGKRRALAVNGHSFKDASGNFMNFEAWRIDMARDYGALPLFTWAPEQDGITPRWDQPDFQCADVANGDYDAYITQFAQDAAAYGHEFLLRYAWEMNGNWYPWAVHGNVNGNTPADYVAAWRHVHDIFQAQGATNVKWVWNVNETDGGWWSITGLYPGDNYVDYMSIDGYNWGSGHSTGWRTFAQVFGGTYDELLLLSDKPIILYEFASKETGGDKAAWITDALLTQLPLNFPQIRMMLWFDWEDAFTEGPPDSSPESLTAWQNAIADDYYIAGEAPAELEVELDSQSAFEPIIAQGLAIAFESSSELEAVTAQELVIAFESLTQLESVISQSFEITIDSSSEFNAVLGQGLIVDFIGSSEIEHTLVIPVLPLEIDVETASHLEVNLSVTLTAQLDSISELDAVLEQSLNTAFDSATEFESAIAQSLSIKFDSSSDVAFVLSAPLEISFAGVSEFDATLALSLKAEFTSVSETEFALPFVLENEFESASILDAVLSQALAVEFVGSSTLEAEVSVPLIFEVVLASESEIDASLAQILSVEFESVSTLEASPAQILDIAFTSESEFDSILAQILATQFASESEFDAILSQAFDIEFESVTTLDTSIAQILAVSLSGESKLNVLLEKLFIAELESASTLDAVLAQVFSIELDSTTELNANLEKAGLVIEFESSSSIDATLTQILAIEFQSFSEFDAAISQELAIDFESSSMFDAAITIDLLLSVTFDSQSEFEPALAIVSVLNIDLLSFSEFTPSLTVPIRASFEGFSDITFALSISLESEFISSTSIDGVLANTLEINLDFESSFESVLSSGLAIVFLSSSELDPRFTTYFEVEIISSTEFSSDLIINVFISTLLIHGFYEPVANVLGFFEPTIPVEGFYIPIISVEVNGMFEAGDITEEKLWFWGENKDIEIMVPRVLDGLTLQWILFARDYQTIQLVKPAIPDGNIARVMIRYAEGDYDDVTFGDHYYQLWDATNRNTLGFGSAHIFRSMPIGVMV